jgi:hypothetical protein
MQTIKDLAQFEYLVFLIHPNEARRLLHIYFLLQVSIQKSSLHIHMVDCHPF